MKRRTFAGIVIAIASTGFIPVPDPNPPVEARAPINWKVGEYQHTQFDAIPGDTITVFYARRNTPVNLQKCLDSGGAGLILIRWRNKVWEACPNVDF